MIRPPGAAGFAPARATGARRVVAPDPRLAARRIAVRRDEGRRRLRRLLWTGGAVGALVLALGITRTPLLDVDRVQVRGAEQVSPELVEATLDAAGVGPGRALLDVDLADGRTALEALPGVQEAELHRRWPGTIEVRIRERTPIAQVAVPGGVAQVGEDGVVVAIAPAVAPSLTVVDGPPDLEPGDRYEDGDVLAVAAALPEELRAVVVGVGVGPDGDLELRLVEDRRVRLGTAEQLGAKLVAAATVLEQVDTHCLATIDVRVPSAPAVTRGARC